MGVVTIYGNNYKFEGLTLLGDTMNYHSRFNSARFRSCNFEGNRFIDCDFSNATVLTTSFKRASFGGGTYPGVSFDLCDFSQAWFEGCVFMKTVFAKCDFTQARFINCKFIDCTFRNCQLGYIGKPTFLDGAIEGCKYMPYIPMACPESGPIIGYKKATTLEHLFKRKSYFGLIDVIVKLEIPEDAKRSSALGRKCRCNKAKVLGIYAIQQIVEPVGVRENGIIDTVIRRRIGDKFSDDMIAYSKYVSTPGSPADALPYKVGQWVFPDDWDDNRFDECSHGIHFFMSAQEAVDY